MNNTADVTDSKPIALNNKVSNVFYLEIIPNSIANSDSLKDQTTF
jgi:hypothetical protein